MNQGVFRFCAVPNAALGVTFRGKPNPCAKAAGCRVGGLIVDSHSEERNEKSKMASPGSFTLANLKNVHSHWEGF
jgi:hypothetical protein